MRLWVLFNRSIIMRIEKTQCAIVDLKGHEKTIRSYVEMRALFEAYVKAKSASESIFRTGSDAYWADMRAKMENYKRGVLRRAYTNEVRRDLTEVLDSCRRNGVSGYIDYLAWLSDQAFMYRRELDQLIYDEMEYARRNEKLWGVIGKLAVLIKLRSDIAMTTLAFVAPPGLSATLVDVGYSSAMDLVGTVSSTDKVDVFCFQGTALSVIAPTLQHVMEMDSGATKILNWPLAVKSIVQALMSAKSDWDKFS